MKLVTEKTVPVAETVVSLADLRTWLKVSKLLAKTVRENLITYEDVVVVVDQDGYVMLAQTETYTISEEVCDAGDFSITHDCSWGTPSNEDESLLELLNKINQVGAEDSADDDEDEDDDVEAEDSDDRSIAAGKTVVALQDIRFTDIEMDSLGDGIVVNKGAEGVILEKGLGDDESTRIAWFDPVYKGARFDNRRWYYNHLFQIDASKCNCVMCRDTNLREINARLSSNYTLE